MVGAATVVALDTSGSDSRQERWCAVTSADNTFAGQLRHFARSVDIVDDRIFERVRLLMYKYVKDELGAAYFELMRDQPIGSDSGLRMFWSSEEKDHAWPVKQADGSCTNIVTLACYKRQPLWIVDENKRPLREADKLEDQWSNTIDLPAYEPALDHAVRMVVVLPLRRQRSLGVCYFESLTHIGITEVARVELQRLADAIAILLELYEAKRAQASLTSAAVQGPSGVTNWARAWYRKGTAPVRFANCQPMPAYLLTRRFVPPAGLEPAAYRLGGSGRSSRAWAGVH